MTELERVDRKVARLRATLADTERIAAVAEEKARARSNWREPHPGAGYETRSFLTSGQIGSSGLPTPDLDREMNLEKWKAAAALEQLCLQLEDLQQWHDHELQERRRTV